MKKLFCIIAIILLLAGGAPAVEWGRGSGSQTADALIYTGEGVFYGIMVATDATNAVTVSVYDGTTATGTKLIPTSVVTTSRYRPGADTQASGASEVLQRHLR